MKLTVHHSTYSLLSYDSQSTLMSIIYVGVIPDYQFVLKVC